MSRLVSAFVALAALALAGAAQAATYYNYNLNVADPAAGFGNVASFGTVQVTDNGIDLYVSVALASGYEFRFAPDSNHHDLTFKLDKNGETAAGLKGYLSNNTLIHYFYQDVGTAFHQSPFGQPNAPWNYAIDCTQATSASRHHAATPGCVSGWNPADNPTKMDFKLAGVNINDLVSVPYTSPHGMKHIFFATDIVSNCGLTGAVGATWDGNPQIGVPEPATWGLMILGFGTIGGALRRRRMQLALAA
jgi:hypothetical protein